MVDLVNVLVEVQNSSELFEWSLMISVTLGLL